MKKRVMILGVGAFAHSMMGILKKFDADVGCYLTREYGHYGPSLEGPTWSVSNHPSPIPILREFLPDLIIPMSIDWHTEPWAEELLQMKIPIFCPDGDAIQIEVQRTLAADLCQQYNIPVPHSYRVSNRIEAMQLMEEIPRPYVIKNPLCSPYSPVHTIVCETAEDTIGWLDRVDYAEGVFLQEYLGTAEAGHFVFVSGGEIFSLATNQEYKRAFTGNMGPVAGAPMGGIVEQDSEDRYGLARELIHPLLPWLRKTGFHGPLQVTAIQKDNQWHVIEYNVRLGVTSAAMFLYMLENPLEALLDVAQNRIPTLHWNQKIRYGCSLTLAGHGYPYIIPSVPRLPVSLFSTLDCDLWWNEVDQEKEQLYMAHHKVSQMGHRIADVVACSDNLEPAIRKVYSNIKKIRCLGSYYRTDLGETLWPPGNKY